MRVAIPVEGGQIFGHFGQSKRFLLVDVADGKIAGQTEVDASQTGGHAALIPFLAERGVTHVIAGNIGEHARNKFAQLNIPVTAGIQGDPVEAVRMLAAGTLTPGENEGCGCGGHGHHHDHEH